MDNIWLLVQPMILKHRDKPYIVSETKKLSYGDLDQISSQVAGFIEQSALLNQNRFVPVLMDRCELLPAVIAGIWRAGGVYVPMDPRQSDEHVNYVLKNTGSGFLLTDLKNKRNEPHFNQWIVEEIIAENLSFSSAIEYHKEAYLMYTGSSEGSLKGVITGHKALENFLNSIQTYWPYTAEPIGGCLAPVIYDVSIWEMFSILIKGGTLYVLSGALANDAQALTETLIREKIDQLYIPPGMISELALVCDSQNPELPLKRILAGGEPLKPEHLLRIRRSCRDVVLLNGYGCKETTVCCTIFPFSGDDHPFERVPIGWPMPGCLVKLVDNSEEIVAEGELGEIWVGGDSLSMGYLNDDQANAKYFTTDIEGRRWFKTGDLAVMLKSGGLVFSGRRDRQVKFRGNKIEPVEIELAINKFPGVEESAVIQAVNSNGFQYLQAFAAGRALENIDPGEVLWFLSERVPDYMIPSRLHILPALPRNLDGKIDRIALQQILSISGRADKQAETDLERKILECWKEVLKNNEIGTNDSFFFYGANSLTAARMAAKIEIRTGRTCRIGMLMKYPTVRLLAKKLEEQNSITDRTVVESGDDEGRIPITPTQQELIFLHEVDPSGRTHNILTRFDIKTGCEPECLMQSLKNFIETQPSLHIRFNKSKGQWFQEPIPGFKSHLPFRSLLGKSEQEKQKILDETIDQVNRISFDLEKGPMQTGILLQFEPDFYHFIWSVHHLVFDGWSMSVMLKAIRDGIAGQLADRQVNYESWIRENLDQYARVSDEQIEKRIGQLSSFAYPLDFPIHKAGFTNLITDGDRVWFNIPKETQVKLEKLALELGSTFFNTLYTIYGILLSFYGGRHQFLIGTPFANRHTELADQVTGYGITVLPLGFKLDCSKSFEINLHENGQLITEGYDLTYVSPGQIIKRLNSLTPGHEESLLQAMFILQNWEHHEDPASAVSIVQTDIGNQTAKMAITLNAEQVQSGLECWLEFQTRALDKEQVEGMAKDLLLLIEKIIADPGVTISGLRNEIIKEMPAVEKHAVAAFIGETSLCLSSMKYWMETGGSIAGIMSNHPDTIRFARENGLFLIPYGRNHLAEFEKLAFDYLFSVVNSFILKPETISLARLGCINFHDSLLPEFAGVNATSWAISSGKTTHGISWHYMEPGTDEGDIILQKSFKIDPLMTVFDLDTRCYEYGISGFKELVAQIKMGKPQGVKQKGKFTYYGLHKKLPCGGVLRFNDSGESILRLHRSIAFSAYYPNAFSSLKLLAQGRIVYPNKVNFISASPSHSPGTITSWDQKMIRVAVPDGILEILQPEDRFRNPVNIETLVHELDKGEGSPAFKIIQAEGVGEWMELLSKNERKWVRYWENQSDPVNRPALDDSAEIYIEELAIQNMNDRDIAIALLVFLKMVDSSWNFGLRIDDKGMTELNSLLTEMVLPITIREFDPQDVVAFYEDLQRQFSEAVPEKSYASDLFFRYPQLRWEGWLGPQYRWTISFGGDFEKKLNPGDIMISNGRIRISMAKSRGYQVEIPNWKARLLRWAPYFKPEHFGDPIPDDVLLLQGEIAEIKPEIVWGYRSMGDWFVEIAKTYPEKPAIIHGDRKVSFEDTYNMVRRVARALDQHDSRVHKIAVSIDRSPEAIIAQLAIYLLGYTYIPIDPNNPESRIRYVLQKSRPTLLLTTRELYKELKPISQAPVKLWDDMVISREINDWPEVSEDSIAYMLFTSGSTGEPKGVPISHGALSRFIQDSIYRYNLTHQDVGLQFASLAFDASMEEIFPILLAGGSLVLRNEDWLGSIGGFLNNTKDYGITFLDLPTAYWQILVRDMHKSGQRFPDQVRQVIIGGDYAQPSTFDMWKEMYPEYPILVNTYGPTEATVVCVAWNKTLANENKAALPIGLPVNSLKSKLVIKNGLDAPPGIPGELWMSGPTLSPGYYENPILTSKKWVQRNNDLWYKTGDWVHRNAEGVMYFIGRQDDQIKVGGFLVDLNEVTKVLSQLDGVREAAVRAISKGDQKIIIGYVYFPGGAPDENFIKEKISQSLPAYMIPSRILLVDHIPYNQNNKIDWRKLPVPDQLTSVSAESAVSDAKDPLEKQLQLLWQHHLGISHLNPEANFFDLGLSSLTAVSVLSEIETLIGRPIPLAILLQYPSVKSLAQGLKEDQEKEFFRPLVQIKPGGSKRPLFIIHGAGLNVLLFNTLKDLMDPEQPIFGIQAKGMDGESPILTKLQDIIDSYAAEIKSAQPQGPYALAGFSLGGMVAFELARQMTERGELVDFVGVFDTYAESSYRSWSKSRLAIHHLKWNWNKLWYNLFLILREPRDVIPKKLKWLRFKFRRWMTGDKLILGEDLQNLPDKLFHIANATIRAVSELELKPYMGEINVFKAAHRNFYIPDQKFLGWKPYGDKGVKIWNIPGDHSHIFAEPNDKIFSKILQQALDESYEKFIRG